MSYCLVSFGSNLGDRRAVLAKAATLLSRIPAIHDLRTSRLFETPSVGGPDGQAPFLNAVGAFQTSATAREILEALQHIETTLGRQRQQRWDARSIDLDVVLYGDLTGGGDQLIVPHPRYTARAFVLEPACDIVPEWKDPRFGWTIQRLASHLRQGVPSMALVGGDAEIRRKLCEQVESKYGVPWFPEPMSVSPISVTANVPAAQQSSLETNTLVHQSARLQVGDASRWLAAYVPPLPVLEQSVSKGEGIPRLVARLQQTDPVNRWPAPHQIWPRNGCWPEYRLEVGNFDWAVGELASALESMCCPVHPVTNDGNWFEKS